jgi:pyruvate dehydrogenase E1 component beta subunit
MVQFAEAIRRALQYAMETDPSVFVMGLGVDDHKAVFGSTKGLVSRFGRTRVFDTPISEGAMTGVAIGAALGGLKPIHVHMRCDFLYLALDQLLNLAAKWRAMFGGQMSLPMVIRAVIGRSWGQGAQHSQNLQAIFMHVPGIKVATPTTPLDAQGLLLTAIADPNPVLILEHRLLYDAFGEIPDPCAGIPFGRAVIRRRGGDLTLVANSHMVIESFKAAEFLAQHGVEVEIVDPVSLVPLDGETILGSVRKTGRLLVVDGSWTTCGMSAEIAALVAEKAFDALKCPVRRMGMKPTACPVSKPLEELFYPQAHVIAGEVLSMIGSEWPKGEMPVFSSSFKGPF